MNKFTLTIDGEKITSESHGSTSNADTFVLFCHGFPGTNRLVKLPTTLEKKQVTVIEINYRGDKESGGKFSFLNSIDDIKKVAIYLRDGYDCKKLYALGYSMGGFYIANMLKDEPNIFNKAILLNPVVDTQALFSNRLLMDKLWVSANDILSLSSPEFYEKEIKTINEKYNPMSFAHKLKTPIDIVQSADDEVLLPENAKKFYALLNCEKSYFEVSNTKHDFWGDEKRLVEVICS
jgi:esterase/lipase